MKSVVFFIIIFKGQFDTQAFYKSAKQVGVFILILICNLKKLFTIEGGIL
jgi:hypothetical protein